MEHTIPALAEELDIPKSTLYSASNKQGSRDGWARRESATILINTEHPRFQSWLVRYRQGRHGPRIVPETPKQRWNQEYWQRRRAKQNEFSASFDIRTKTS